jgi:hypothetical protein
MLTFVPFQEETVAKLTFAGLPVDLVIESPVRSDFFALFG